MVDVGNVFDGVDHAMGDGNMIKLGDSDYGALHTPGHKNDHR